MRGQKAVPRGSTAAHSRLVAEILLRFGSRPDLRLWRSQPLAARTPSGRVIRALPVGFPDISGVLAPSGRAVFIEVKTGDAHQNPAQARLCAALRRFGALVVLAQSCDDVSRTLPPQTDDAPRLPPQRDDVSRLLPPQTDDAPRLPPQTDDVSRTSPPQRDDAPRTLPPPPPPEVRR